MLLRRCRVFFADLREGNEEGAVTSGNLMRPGSFRRFGTHPPMCAVVPYSPFASPAIGCCIEASCFDVSVDSRSNCCLSSAFSLVKRFTFLGELFLEDFLYVDFFLSLFIGGEDFLLRNWRSNRIRAKKQSPSHRIARSSSRAIHGSAWLSLSWTFGSI